MMRSLYSAVSGLRNHQTRMDVIGNNVANVNTAGYKSSRVVFQDIFSQTISTASAPIEEVRGGTNPMQVGLGMNLASIDIMHLRTATQYTGAPLDVAIEGDGFFVIQVDGANYFTRAGNFYTDNENNLVNAQGFYVMGYMSEDQPSAGDEPEILNIPEEYYDISIDSNGAIIGLERETNERVTIGYICVTTFNNQQALQKIGNNLYRETVNSGEPIYSGPGIEGAGLLSPGALEMSNVDLAKEFTDMIVTQRGFQANSRVITVSDTMLEELVNLKR